MVVGFSSGRLSATTVLPRSSSRSTDGSGARRCTAAPSALTSSSVEARRAAATAAGPEARFFIFRNE